MIQPSILNSLLPRAVAWASSLEQRALSDAQGLQLTPRQQDLARRAGVSNHERVRILPVPEIPLPEEPGLREAARMFGVITPGTVGLTLGHAILIREECLADPMLIAHELKHVAQYEQQGSMSAFLGRYLSEFNLYGYLDAPMEVEARAFAESCDL